MTESDSILARNRGGGQLKTADSTGDVAVSVQAHGYDSTSSSTPDRTVQEGELTKIIDRRTLVFTYLLIWAAQFALEFASGTTGTLTPYITSSFEKHSLTATTSIIANIASGIIGLPYAKILNLWGRPQGLACMIACATIGCLLMAVCNNVETFCAAQVFFNVGYVGIQFSLMVFISDLVPLSHRGLVIGWIGSPSIAALWAYGPATQALLSSASWRWGCGIWCVIVPVFWVPILLLFFKFARDKKKADPNLTETSSLSAPESFTHQLKEFDVVGLLVLATGLSLLLLALSIYSYQAERWKSPLIICFLTFGPLLIISFVLYEKYLAPVTFLPWSLIKNPTVIFTNLMSATLYASKLLSHSYLYSLLIVVFDQSVTGATYIQNIYFVGSTVWNILLGFAFRYYGHIKHYALFVGIPFFAIGTGLMIKFRTSNTHIGFMIMCEILMSFGAGTMWPIEQMNLMAVSQEHFPSLLAVQYLIMQVGKATGSAIATAIWTSMFKDKLIEYLPASEKSKATEIYGSLELQSGYPVGSPARDAIDHAYGDTQRIILIVATSVLAITTISITFWRDIDVKGSKIAQRAG